MTGRGRTGPPAGVLEGTMERPVLYSLNTEARTPT